MNKDALLAIADIAVHGCPFRRRIINGGETWVPLADAERARAAALRASLTPQEPK
jgi:hypothetical protein